MRWLCAALCCILLIATSLVVGTRFGLFASEYYSSISPNHRFQVTVYQHIRLGPSFPGQGSDGSGHVVLKDLSSDQIIGREHVPIINAIGEVYWEPRNISVGKFIEFPLPSTSGAPALALYSEPLYRAARNKDFATVESLLLQDDYIASLNQNHSNILCDQLIQKNIPILTLLLRNGLNPNVTNEHGYTPLYNAIISSDADAFHVLVKHGATLNLNDSSIQYALQRSSESFKKKIRRYLEPTTNASDL